MTKIKIKVNEKCICGSNLKYKKCCMNKQITEDAKWTTTQTYNSEEILKVIEILQPEFEDICIINITENLNATTYETYQKTNYYTNIMMIAERTAENESVFETRSNSELSTIIVMYHGAYRTFSFNNLLTHTDYIIESINQML